jgi:hypothetical protein
LSSSNHCVEIFQPIQFLSAIADLSAGLAYVASIAPSEEADVAVILHADGLDARNLYVAMTRGSRQLVVCSASPLLG